MFPPYADGFTLPHLSKGPVHLSQSVDHPQRHQQYTEEAEAPAQNIGPGRIHIGFIELQRLILHDGEEEGSLNKTKTMKYNHAPITSTFILKCVSFCTIAPLKIVPLQCTHYFQLVQGLEFKPELPNDEDPSIVFQIDTERKCTFRLHSCCHGDFVRLVRLYYSLSSI